jgi:hypothetical protein
MASTYTANSGIELIASGEQSGTWGITTNTNLSIIDRLVNGVGTIVLAGTTHTLTTSDGVLSDGQFAVLVFGGAPSGPNTVTIAPNDGQHVYIVRNISGESVILTQGSGGNVTVATGDTKIVYTDGAGSGAAVVDITADFAMSSVKITGGSITGITDLAIADGGTGASDAGTARTNLGLAIGTDVQAYDAELTAIAGLAVTDGNFIVGNGTTWVAENGSTARTSLGLGTMSTQDASSVSITGGSITGITDLAVADGGTGASDAGTARTNLGLTIGTDVQAYDAELTAIAGLAVTDGNFIVGNGTTWVAENGSTARASLGLTIGTDVQAYDAELTAIAGLAVTDGNFIVGNGTTWVAENGSTARTSLGLTIGTDVQAYDAGLQSIAGLTTSADQMIYTTASDTYATTSLTAAGRAILDDADASAQRTTLGLVIGTNVQAYDAGLQSIAGLTTAADRMIYTTASDVYAVTTLTAAGRAILDDADAAAQRTTLGLVIGTDVQAYDAELTAIAGLSVTDGNFIVGNGTTWVAESGSTARTSLGLGTIATQASSSVTITGGTINGTAIGGSTPAAGSFTTITTSGDATFGAAIVETVYALSGTTPALNPSNGTIQTWTLSGNSSPTDSLAAGESLTLMVDDGSASTITWPSVTWKTDGGVAPTLNTTGFTAIVLWKVGSVLYGARVGNA